MSVDLITLDELKYALSDDIDEATPELDQRLRKAISGASEAVRKFADRSFGEPNVVATRIYDYDYSGYLDIDDAWEVQTVEFVMRSLGFPLTNEYWRAEPVAGPPYEYIIVPKWAGIYSPQMGFRRNLDRISKEANWVGVGPQVKITAKWGWPEVPQDVRQAVIWTAANFAEKPDQMVGESIANYSYTSQSRASQGPPPAIPSKAQDILAPYVRFQI